MYNVKKYQAIKFDLEKSIWWIWLTTFSAASITCFAILELFYIWNSIFLLVIFSRFRLLFFSFMLIDVIIYDSYSSSKNDSSFSNFSKCFDSSIVLSFVFFILILLFSYSYLNSYFVGFFANPYSFSYSSMNFSIYDSFLSFYYSMVSTYVDLNGRITFPLFIWLYSMYLITRRIFFDIYENLL